MSKVDGQAILVRLPDGWGALPLPLTRQADEAGALAFARGTDIGRQHGVRVEEG